MSIPSPPKHSFQKIRGILIYLMKWRPNTELSTFWKNKIKRQIKGELYTSEIIYFLLFHSLFYKLLKHTIKIIHIHSFMIYPFHSFINSQTWCKRITNNYFLSNFDSLPFLNSCCCNVNLLYSLLIIFLWSFEVRCLIILALRRLLGETLAIHSRRLLFCA